MRELHIAHERIKQLEIENTKLVVERNTLRYISLNLFQGNWY